MALGLVQVLADANQDGYTVLGQSSNAWEPLGIVASADDADGPLLGFTTRSQTNGIAGIQTSDVWYQTRFGSTITFRIKTGASVSTCRIVVGVSDVPGAQMQTPEAHMAAFVYDTVAHGTAFWRAVTSDGSGTLTTTATAQSIATSTLYSLTIDFADPASLKFYSGTTLLATHTTNLPTSSTPLRVGAWVCDLTTGIS